MVSPISVRKNILPWEASNRPGNKLLAGDLLEIIHETGNTTPGADAESQIAYIHTADARKRQASYHLSVDDGECWQGLPLDEVGWAAGDGCDNPSVDRGCFRGIHIEACQNQGIDEAKRNRNLAEIVARIAAGDPAFDWGSGSTKGRFSINRLEQHYWVSDDGPNKHDCPQWLRHHAAPLDWATWLTWVDDAWTTFGVTPAPPPAYAPRKPVAGSATFRRNGQTFFYAPQTVHALRQVTPKQFAGAKELATGPDILKGGLVALLWLVVSSSDGKLWAITKEGDRIPAEAVA